MKLYGGFDPANGIDDLSDTRITPTKAGAPAGGGTILSGDFNGDDQVTGSGSTLSITHNTENAYHVIVAANTSSITTEIDGFTITGGNANGTSNITVNSTQIYQTRGGGIYSSSSSSSSSVTVTNSSISGNSATYGGGIYSYSFSSYSSVNVTNSIISGNSASNNGGGIYSSSSSSITVTGSSVSGNSASSNGGGIYSSSSFSSNTIKLLSITLAGNTGNSFIYYAYGSNSFISYNSLVYGNKTSAGADATMTADNGNINKTIQ